MRPKKPLKSSFVVTVSAAAAAAAAAACGGKALVDNTTGITNPPVIEPPDITNPPPPPPDCPQTEPTEGNSCALTSACTYVDACKTRGTNGTGYHTYTCASGTWERADAKYIASCPASRPIHGNPCGACVDGYVNACSYPNQWEPACPPETFMCNPKMKTWTSFASSCNPPPPDAGPAPFDAGPGGDGG